MESPHTTHPLLLKAKEFLADLLFPRACVGCGSGHSYLCDACLRAAPRKHEHRCPFCGSVIVPDGLTCLSCASRHSLDGVFAAVAFREAFTVADAIHVLKYEYVPELALPLGRLLAEAAAKTDLPLPDLLLPVPLHPWRLRYRGFNQSTLIARSFSESFMPELPVPVREDLLVRHRFTLPQAKSRGAKERKRNLHGAFSLQKNSPAINKEFKGKTLWLVDDVATTGATLEECAKVLKKSGAKKVFGIVVAR
ncbi:MAG TPA: double zinc ribbon domain-containing protein [Candidatus Fimivivens sp.]|nr:double zinc ribbon domain-containing protein [Candidatus Fimivivens sp.]